MAEIEKKRGGCLSTILILGLIFSPLSGLYFLFGSSELARAMPWMSEGLLQIAGLMTLANFVFFIGIWKWKKWGVYGYGAVSLISIIMTASAGAPFSNVIFSLIGFGIVITLVTSAWPQFD